MMMSKLAERIAKLPANRQDEFRHFVDSGEASEDFLDWLDVDSDAQAAVEVAFEAQLDGLERFRAEVHEMYPPPKRGFNFGRRSTFSNQFGLFWNDSILIAANWQGWLVVAIVIVWILL